MNKLVKLQVNLDNSFSNPHILNFTVKKLDDILMEVGVKSSDPSLNIDQQSIVLYGLRSDGERLKQTDNISINNDIIYIKVNNAFTCIKGKVEFELEFKDDNGQLSSHSIMCLVQERIGNENSFEVITVEHLKGANSEAKENITNLEGLNTVALDRFNDLDRLVETSLQTITDLQAQLEVSINTHRELVNSFNVIKQWADNFDYDQSIPQMKEDINYLINKPTTVKVY